MSLVCRNIPQGREIYTDYAGRQLAQVGGQDEVRSLYPSLSYPVKGNQSLTCHTVSPPKKNRIIKFKAYYVRPPNMYPPPRSRQQAILKKARACLARGAQAHEDTDGLAPTPASKGEGRDEFFLPSGQQTQVRVANPPRTCDCQAQPPCVYVCARARTQL